MKQAWKNIWLWSSLRDWVYNKRCKWQTLENIHATSRNPKHTLTRTILMWRRRRTMTGVNCEAKFSSPWHSLPCRPHPHVNKYPSPEKGRNGVLNVTCRIGGLSIPPNYVRKQATSVCEYQFTYVLPVIAAEWLSPAVIITKGCVCVSITGWGIQHSTSPVPCPNSPLLPKPHENTPPPSGNVHKLYSVLHYVNLSHSHTPAVKKCYIDHHHIKNINENFCIKFEYLHSMQQNEIWNQI